MVPVNTDIPKEELLFKKATLALGGGVKLPSGYTLPVRISHSTAGPGAGNDSVVFAFHESKVKKSVSYDTGEFELVVGTNDLSLTHNGEPFLDGVTIEPVVYHCPGQAFFTIDNRCGFDCAFCASPRLPDIDFKDQRPDDIAMKCLDEYLGGRISAVSFTSGVYEGDVIREVTQLNNCIRAVRTMIPSIPIGVEPYLDSEKQVVSLKGTGANEIKLNLQAATPEIFKKVCPDLDRDTILKCLRAAVEVFGKGNVTSNVIYGMGETEEELTSCIEDLCAMGVIPVLRALRFNKYNRERLKEALGELIPVTVDHMVKVAGIHIRMLTKYGLDVFRPRTMCLECGCCDLVPFKDL
ncbi:MAG: radical SAM protein [archaeon]|nr:radical SAM protein [archaeon]